MTKIAPKEFEVTDLCSWLKCR